MASTSASHILTLSCMDFPGLVGKVSNFLSARNVNILEANHHTERSNGEGFLRFSFIELAEKRTLSEWADEVAPLADALNAKVEVFDATRPMKTVIAVSKFGHCLFDLVHRSRAGALPIEICAVISNHEDMRSFSEWAELPYHHLPITKETKAKQEGEIKKLFAEYDAELLALARYMQILSEDMCATFDGKAINIHHSFLPSFKGARPYSQAHEKGVKIIGATAHYVTTDLDEGPIIEQAVERVDHSTSVEEFMNIGRGTESVALSRAVLWHAERRVMRTGSKTIVFK